MCVLEETSHSFDTLRGHDLFAYRSDGGILLLMLMPSIHVAWNVRAQQHELNNFLTMSGQCNWTVNCWTINHQKVWVVVNFHDCVRNSHTHMNWNYRRLYFALVACKEDVHPAHRGECVWRLVRVTLRTSPACAMYNMYAACLMGKPSMQSRWLCRTESDVSGCVSMM